MTKKNLGYLLSILVLFVAFFSTARAEDPATTQGGPTEAEKAQVESQAKSEASGRAQAEAAAAKAQFESEFGAPPEAYQKHEPVKPQVEKPGKVPEEVKKYLSDSDIVPIYCAMAKWKTGQFFSAMNALKNNLGPKMSEAKNVLGIGMDTPNFDQISSEGQQKLDAICNAKTVDEAEKLTQEFVTFGEELDQKYIGAFMSEFENKMKEKGEELKKKIEESIKPITDEESKKIEPEIDAEARSIASTYKFDHQPSSGEIAAMRAQIEERLKPIIEAKKQQIVQKVQAKVEEVKKSEAGKFIELGKLFEGIDAKIQADTNSGLSEYEKYKTEALQLRRNIILKVLDKNIEEGINKLNDAEKEIEAARKDDPSIKSVSELKSELEKDKQALINKLDAALDSGDENALQGAINEFKTKWENMRAEGEKMASQSVEKACSIAITQFTNARKQMDGNMSQITNIQNKCEGSVSNDCLEVNKFSERFDTLTSKMTDIRSAMDMAEGMCKDQKTADKTNLIALLRRIQSDGEDLRIYGEALNAEKSAVVADSAAKMCAQIIPQLEAAKTEILKNDLSVIKNNLSRCAGKNTDECKTVNEFAPKVKDFDSKVSLFSGKINSITNFCANPKESDFEKIGVTLNTLNDDGDDLKKLGKELREDQAEKASEKALCKAVVPQIEAGKAQLSIGFYEVSKIQNDCSGKKDTICTAIGSLKPKFDSLINKMKETQTKIDNSVAQCKKAGTDVPDTEFVNGLNNTKDTSAELLKMVKEMRDEQEKAKKSAGSGFFIEAENEISTSLLPRTESWHSRKETNPSWRPPFYGSGVWYLSRGGESLSYNISAPTAGEYNIWVRDYVDNFQPVGVRRVTYIINGKSIGTFPEVTLSKDKINAQKGSFGWHKLSAIKLLAGQNSMKVVKESTTSGAAILDSFYFTTGNDIPAEK